MAQFFTRKTVMIIVALIIVAVLLYFVLPVAVPLILAFVTAMMLDPLVRLAYRRGKVNRKLAVLLVFLAFLIFITVIGYLITTKVISEVIQIVENIPFYVNAINDAWRNFEVQLNNLSDTFPEEFIVEISNQIDNFISGIRSELLTYVNVNSVTSLFTNIPGFVVNLLVYMIALFFFMSDLPNIKQRFYDLLKDETEEKVRYMFNNTASFFKGFFKGQFLVSLIILAVTLVSLLIFVDTRLALIMTFVIWLIDFIPIIGSIVILAPWSLYHLITGNIVLGTELAILAAVLLAIRRTVEPKVMGKHMGLSPLATLISLFLGLKLFGVIGFVLGPLALILYKSARESGLIRFDFKI